MPFPLSFRLCSVLLALQKRRTKKLFRTNSKPNNASAFIDIANNNAVSFLAGIRIHPPSVFILSYLFSGYKHALIFIRRSPSIACKMYKVVHKMTHRIVDFLSQSGKTGAVLSLFERGTSISAAALLRQKALLSKIQTLDKHKECKYNKP